MMRIALYLLISSFSMTTSIVSAEAPVPTSSPRIVSSPVALPPRETATIDLDDAPTVAPTVQQEQENERPSPMPIQMPKRFHMSAARIVPSPTLQTTNKDESLTSNLLKDLDTTTTTTNTIRMEGGIRLVSAPTTPMITAPKNLPRLEAAILELRIHDELYQAYQRSLQEKELYEASRVVLETEEQTEEQDSTKEEPLKAKESNDSVVEESVDSETEQDSNVEELAPASDDQSVSLSSPTTLEESQRPLDMRTMMAVIMMTAMTPSDQTASVTELTGMTSCNQRPNATNVSSSDKLGEDVVTAGMQSGMFAMVEKM